MPHKLIRKGFFSELHFDPDNDFVYKEKDKVSPRPSTAHPPAGPSPP